MVQNAIENFARKIKARSIAQCRRFILCSLIEEFLFMQPVDPRLATGLSLVALPAYNLQQALSYEVVSWR